MAINSSASECDGVNGFSTMTRPFSTEPTTVFKCIRTVFPGIEGRLRQLRMAFWGCAHEHHVNQRILQHIFHAPIHLDPRVVLFGVIVRLGAPLHHSMEFEVRNSLNKWNVKGFGAEAIANDSDIVLLGCHVEEFDEVWKSSISQPKSAQAYIKFTKAVLNFNKSVPNVLLYIVRTSVQLSV